METLQPAAATSAASRTSRVFLSSSSRDRHDETETNGFHDLAEWTRLRYPRAMRAWDECRKMPFRRHVQETFFPTLDFTFIGMCVIVFVGFTYFSIMKWIACRVPADTFVRAYLASGGVMSVMYVPGEKEAVAILRPGTVVNGSRVPLHKLVIVVDCEREHRASDFRLQIRAAERKLGIREGTTKVDIRRGDDEDGRVVFVIGIACTFAALFGLRRYLRILKRIR